MKFFATKDEAEKELSLLPETSDYDTLKDALTSNIGEYMAGNDSQGIPPDSELRRAQLREHIGKHSNHHVFSVLLHADTNELASYNIYHMEDRYVRKSYQPKWHMLRPVKNTAGNETKWLTQFKDESTYASLGLRKMYAVLPAKVVFGVDKIWRIHPIPLK